MPVQTVFFCYLSKVYAVNIFTDMGADIRIRVIVIVVVERETASRTRSNTTAYNLIIL